MLNRRERAAPAVPVVRFLEAAERRFPALAGRRLSAHHENYTLTTLLGYVRRDLLVTDGQVNQIERQMAEFAKAEGFSMGFTYVEKPGTWPAAFEALIESVTRNEVTAVVLPSMLHFAVLGAPLNIKEMFERATPNRLAHVLDPPCVRQPFHLRGWTEAPGVASRSLVAHINEGPRTARVHRRTTSVGR
jgi:hypothetical protein